MEILNNESAILEFNEPLNSIEVYWKGHIKSDVYREIMEMAYDAIVQFEATQWLADMSNAGVKSVDDQDWVMGTFIPKCAKAGLLRVAVVLSQDVFVKFFVNKVKSKYEENNLMAEYFSSKHEAQEWLKSFI